MPRFFKINKDFMDEFTRLSRKVNKRGGGTMNPENMKYCYGFDYSQNITIYGYIYFITLNTEKDNRPKALLWGELQKIGKSHQGDLKFISYPISASQGLENVYLNLHQIHQPRKDPEYPDTWMTYKKLSEKSCKYPNVDTILNSASCASCKMCMGCLYCTYSEWCMDCIQCDECKYLIGWENVENFDASPLVKFIEDNIDEIKSNLDFELEELIIILPFWETKYNAIGEKKYLRKNIKSLGLLSMHFPKIEEMIPDNIKGGYSKKSAM